MKPDCPVDPVILSTPAPQLLGLSYLMKKAFDGIDLRPLAETMIARASENPGDANSLMDLSTILFLRGNTGVALSTQDLALKVQRLYELPAKGQCALRMLAIMAPGDLQTNAPLPFLTMGTDIDLKMLYLQAGEALPHELPPHDIAYVAVSESSANRALLENLSELKASLMTPLVNDPVSILRTSRDQAFKVLEDAQGLKMMRTLKVSRPDLMTFAAGGSLPQEVMAGVNFPMIVRPVESHAGSGLVRADTAMALADYLAGPDNQHEEYFVSPYVDYRSADGLFRKYRVVLIDGKPFAGHMGISDHWMIHYLNAGMAESAAKREEEAFFMLNFDQDFGRRHALALRTIADRFALDYLIIDCAETLDGDLLVFEVDPGAVLHSMDSLELFPYKEVPMKRVRAAFREMLIRAR